MVQQWKNASSKNKPLPTMKRAEQSSRCDKGISIHTVPVEFKQHQRDVCVCARLICVLQLHAYACALFIIFFCYLWSHSKKRQRNALFLFLFMLLLLFSATEAKENVYTKRIRLLNKLATYWMRSKLKWLNFIRFVVMKNILKWSVPLLQTILVVSTRWFEVCTHTHIYAREKNVGSYCGTRHDVTHHLNRFRPYQSTLRAKLKARDRANTSKRNQEGERGRVVGGRGQKMKINTFVRNW